MKKRSHEIEVLALAMGSASELRVSERAVLRRMRHADVETAKKSRRHAIAPDKAGPR